QGGPAQSRRRQPASGRGADPQQPLTIEVAGRSGPPQPGQRVEGEGAAAFPAVLHAPSTAPPLRRTPAASERKSPAEVIIHLALRPLGAMNNHLGIFRSIGPN